MQKLIEKKPSSKVVTIFLVAFVVFSGLILSLGAYYSKNNGKVAGAEDVVDQVKLADDYRVAFKQAFQNYLILDTNADWMSDDLLATTISIKNNLLSLKVPADLKDSHLKAVIALTEIEQGIQTRNLDLILPNIYKLREIIDNF